MEPVERKRRVPSQKGKESVAPSDKGGRKSFSEKTLFLRIVLASLIFCAAVVVDFSRLQELCLYAAAVIICGYDLFIPGVKAALSGELRDSRLILFFVCAVAFAVGFASESVCLIVLYRVGRVITGYLCEKSEAGAFARIDRRETSLLRKAEEAFSSSEKLRMHVSGVIMKSAEPILLGILIVGLGCAVLLPTVSNFNIRVAVHRAITIIFVATSESILLSMKPLALNALCQAAAGGTVFKDIETLENIDGVKTVIFDKTDVFDAPEPNLLYAHSEILDTETFITFAAHVVHESTQSFADVILKEFYGEYNSSLISEFSESPGGVEAKFIGTPVVFGTRSFVSSHSLQAPSKGSDDGVSYYLFLAGRYGGEIVISDDSGPDISDIVHALRLEGVNKFVLMTSENQEEVSEFANTAKFDSVYTGIGSEMRESLISDLVNESRTKKLLLNSDVHSEHSAADIEIRLGSELGEGDAVTGREYVAGLPEVFALSRRIPQLAFGNAMICFCMKALVVFLSIIGYCNLWMAVIAETAAAAVTILNISRLTSRSVFTSVFNK